MACLQTKSSSAPITLYFGCKTSPFLLVNIYCSADHGHDVLPHHTFWRFSVLEGIPLISSDIDYLDMRFNLSKQFSAET